MNIAICDDDRRILDEIKGYVDEFFADKGMEYELYLFSDGESFFASDTVFDIAFVDVEMPGVNGLSVAKRIYDTNENAFVIIVTCHNDYLDDAMEISVYRYLTKPLDKDRLMLSLSKAVKRYFDIAEPVILQTEDGSDKVNTGDIIYLAIENRKTAIHTVGTSYVSPKSIEWWKNNLNQRLFAQPHKSYLVNLRYVVGFDKNEVRLLARGKEYKVYCSQRKYVKFKHTFYAYLRGTSASGGVKV